VGTLGVGNHEFDGFFAFSQQQLESPRKPDILRDHRFSTSSTNPYSSLCKSLNFRVGSLGSIRLSDPTKSDLSAGKTATMPISESLVGFSGEVKSPVSFATTSIEDKVEELDKIMGNLDLGEAMDRSDLDQEDFTT
jgi:hypothetical protein